MLAGGSDSEGVLQNRHSPGCPAAVHSTAGEETSSHLEEIRTESICVKNKKDKNRNTKKEETLSFAQHVQPVSQPLVPFKVRGICTRSAMPAPGAAPWLGGAPREGFIPAASEVTPQTCCSCFSSAAGRGLDLPRHCSRSLGTPLFSVPLLHLTTSLRQQRMRAPIPITPTKKCDSISKKQSNVQPTNKAKDEANCEVSCLALIFSISRAQFSHQVAPQQQPRTQGRIRWWVPQGKSCPRG